MIFVLPEYGMAFCRDGISIFSDDYYCAGSIGDKPRPVPARAVVCIY